MLDWNRIYGPHGLLPVPDASCRARRVCAAIARHAGRDRAVGRRLVAGGAEDLRRSPAAGPAELSARPGVTLALDFRNTAPASQRLFERLDAIVRAAGGRLYPAKDARMPRDDVRGGLSATSANLRGYRDPGMSSAMSRRLMGSCKEDRHEDRRHRRDVGDRRALLPAVGRARGLPTSCWWRATPPRPSRVAEDLRVREPGFDDHRGRGRLPRHARRSQAVADRRPPQRPIDIVLIAHGVLPEQQQAEGDLALCRDTLRSERRVARAVRRGLRRPVRQGRARHDRDHRLGRGRSRPQGQLHLRRQQGPGGALRRRGWSIASPAPACSVVLIKPGPTDTPMAATHRAARPARWPRSRTWRAPWCAASTPSAPVVYAPANWALIMLVVRHLPRFIFNRLNL